MTFGLVIKLPTATHFTRDSDEKWQTLRLRRCASRFAKNVTSQWGTVRGLRGIDEYPQLASQYGYTVHHLCRMAAAWVEGNFPKMRFFLMYDAPSLPISQSNSIINLQREKVRN